MNRIEKARMMRPYIVKALAFLDDTDALNVVDIFPVWDANNITYVTGDRVRYNGELYKCLQGHTSQEAWTPIDAPSLFAKVLTDENKILPWEQPDSTNTYKAGDQVIHNNYIWKSTVDNNSWEPGVYGWEQVSEA